MGHDDIILNPAAVDALRRECFSLLVRELHRIAAWASAAQEERGELSELLSLIYMLLARCSSGLDVLSESDTLADLVVVLQGQTTPPEAKRLALRLVQKLLPRQPEGAFRSFVSLCFSQIGRWLIGGLSDPATLKASSAAVPAAAKKGEFKEAVPITGATPCELFVVGWTAGASRMFEELFNNMGQEFIVNFAGGMPNPTPDAVVRRIVEEMTKRGRALVYSGTFDDCSKYTRLLGQFGCTLLVVPVASSSPAASASASAAAAAAAAGSSSVGGAASPIASRSLSRISASSAASASSSVSSSAAEPPQVPVQSVWTSSHAAFSLARSMCRWFVRLRLMHRIRSGRALCRRRVREPSLI